MSAPNTPERHNGSGGGGDARTSQTAGEEVLRTLYQRALNDKNTLQETNDQYCKMLQACAEQNNMRERETQEAKQESEECRKQAAQAEEEKNAAVIRMQKFEVHSVAELEKYKAQAAKTSSDLQTRLAKAEERAARNEANHAEVLSSFREQNTFLESELQKKSTSLAFVPRLVTEKQNEIRKEYAHKMADVAEALVSTEKKMHQAAQNHAKEIAQLNKAKDALAAEVADLKLQLVKQQEKTVEVQSTANHEVNTMRQQLAVAEEQVRQARLTASEAHNEKAQVLREAQRSLEQSESEFSAKIAETNKAASEKERRVFEALQTAMNEFEQSKQAAEKERSRLSTQLEKVQGELSVSRDELIKVKKELTASTRGKNVALKNLRDALCADMGTMEDMLTQRTQELRNLQQMFNETVAKEKERANEAQRNSQHAEMPTAAVAFGNEQLAQLSQELAATQAKLHDAHSGQLQQDMTQLQAASTAQARVKELQDVINVSKNQFEAQVTAIHAEYDKKLQELFGIAAQETQKHAEEAKRLQETVEYNAKEVEAVKEVKEELAEANKEIVSLRSQLNIADDNAAVGSKRKRKA